jgi:hypothetical protein
MKRLNDEERLSGDDEQLADLLRSAAPYETDPFRKRRILANVERQRQLGVRSFWLRPVVMGALLVSGTAAAALGHRLIVAPAAQEHAPAALGAASKPALAAPIEIAPLAEAAPLRSAAPAEAPASGATPSAKGSARPRTESSEDASHVVEAIQALRTDRDPARAQALLDDYLRSNPRGSLSGDALALSIEAASARHDPRAADYAKKYLASYPNGKYRDLAKRALATH